MMTEQDVRTGTPLDDWNWFDPSSDARFDRKEPAIDETAPIECHLQAVVRLADAIYDHLSVFEQFYANPPGGGRGGKCALGDPSRKVTIENGRAELYAVELALLRLYERLKLKRNDFLSMQLSALGIGASSSGLKVNLGSAGLRIPGWLNVDAGGGDLIANVNWGLPLGDGTASFVYCSHMLEHLRFSDQAPAFVREVHRVLEAGGVARFVVPDMRAMLTAYVNEDRHFFSSRQETYPLSPAFLAHGIATLDYILLFSGAAHQVLNYNHKFGYDEQSLCQLLVSAGFNAVKVCTYQGSTHSDLQIDDSSYNARASGDQGKPFSLFVEATK